jgi:hypothetical protein
MTIFVCDDRPEEGEIEAALAEANDAGAEVADVRVFTKPQLQAGVESLFDAVDAALEGQDIPEHAFDGASLVLLDYGLTKLQRGTGPRLTADHLAGYIRAFSTSFYVVSLNGLRGVDFDLKYLVGDFATRGDLALNTPHLAEPGLWNGKPDDGAFCPWYWPRLEEAGKRRKEQIDLILANPDRPLLDLIRFPPTLVPYLSRQAIAYLSPAAEEGDGSVHAKDVRSVSAWHHFCLSNRTLTKDDRRELVEAFGGKLGQDKCPAPETLRKVVARVVAGELDFWFRRDVQGPQRLLVDAPHLLAAYPYREGATVADIAAWNVTTHAIESPYGLDAGFFESLPPESVSDMWPWIERGTFWMPLIEESQGVEVATAGLKRNNALCFCEDTRRFLSRDACERFATELGTGLDIRFVERLDGKIYRPESAFAR